MPQKFQAITRGKQHDDCMKTIDKQLKDLEKREQERIESEKSVANRLNTDFIIKFMSQVDFRERN
jgi:hypothetical protein